MKNSRLKSWVLLISTAAALTMATSLVFHWMYPEATLVRDARRAYKAGSYLEAAEYYAATREPAGRDRALFHRRELRARLAGGDLEGARRNLEFLVQQDPADLELRRQLAGVLQGLGEPLLAIAQWEFVLEKQTGNVEALFQRAAATLQSGQMELAEIRFHEVLEAREEHPGALLALGKLMAWRGALAEAESVFRDLLARYPRWLEARVFLARVLSWQEKWESSVEEYRLALELFS